MSSRSALERALSARLGSSAEARWMVDDVLGDGAVRTEATDADERTLAALMARRLGGEPLQYVLGSWAFRTLELAVDSRALIPRPETEQVVEVALDALAAWRDAHGAQRLFVADLGTGTGAIALSIAAELGDAVAVYAVDDDPAALALAEENRSRVATTRPWIAGSVELRPGSWFAGLPPERMGAFGLVISNPPYVPEEAWDALDVEVRHEPAHALVAGPGSDGTPGFGAVEAVVRGASEWLAPGGALCVELSPEQADTARALAQRLGYVDVRVATDLAGRDRALVAHRADPDKAPR